MHSNNFYDIRKEKTQLIIFIFELKKGKELLSLRIARKVRKIYKLLRNLHFI